ncbi:hypothetical protein [Burkholderia sp. WAC0059]|uniref:hypothetical protein n=1 Tax=Burkholderia sp. WAC0059 TaxID=2066022 RepID=UPI0011AFA4B5|nr:hypothetical protein [Burkholderia sp. WAC0059]
MERLPLDGPAHRLAIRHATASDNVGVNVEWSAYSVMSRCVALTAARLALQAIFFFFIRRLRDDVERRH